MMNQQEVFDKVVRHLLKQGERAISDNGRCAYNDSHGRKCAVGCLITDEAYNPDIEHRAADTTEVIWALKNSGIDVDWECGDGCGVEGVACHCEQHYR